MCVPKANHRRLIDECYPPPKQLAAAAPDFKPNSNELSRLTYYANAKPAKLTKVLTVLQTKAAASARGLGGSGAAADKSKAGLMITLGVLKQLILDCRSHLSYFAPAAQAIIATALDAAAKPTAAGHRDLDVSARAASTFYALANYLDKESTPSDARYSGLLRSFASMATEGGRDEEEQTRARLIGLGAIAGAVGSDALYSTAFAQQVGIIVPALLSNMVEKASVDLAFLRTESAKAADGTQLFAEYASKRRPVGVRRAPSLSAAAAGEKAPGPRDAASAAMGTMQSLLHHGDAGHVQASIACVVSHLDASGAWRTAPWCAWLAEALASWTAQPYRFVVLTFIVEHLVEAETSAQPKKADTLVLMISTLLRSKLSLIGLSTSDTISNLLGLAVRRTHAAPDDELLSALIDCVGALGAHTYYADQANDCADEICARISALLLPDTDVAEAAKTSFANASRRPIKTGDRARDESLRVLLCCLASLIDSANVPSRKSGAGASARPRMSPDTMAPTCALLASPNPRVRLTYHQTVLFFLQREAGPASDTLPSAGVAQQKEATAFLHAWAAGAFVLALARGLSVPQGASETPLSALPILDRSNAEGVRGSAPETAAQPVDYAGLTAAADAMVRNLPVPATLGLVPGLLALDRAASTRLSPQGVEGQRISAARAFVASTLAALAQVWESSSLARIAQASLSAHNILTSFPAEMPELDAPFDSVPFPGGSAGAASDRGLDTRSVAQALAQSAKLQREASLSEEELQSWLLRDWSVQIAVDDSLVGASPFRSSLDGAAARPFAGDRADGGSDAEADASAPRGVGVDDFREALGSRSYASKRRTNNGDLGSGAPNGSSDPRAERRTSRRVSRKEAAAPVAGVPALLDDLHVGVAEESGADGEQRPALVAPALS